MNRGLHQVAARLAAVTLLALALVFPRLAHAACTDIPECGAAGTRDQCLQKAIDAMLPANPSASKAECVTMAVATDPACETGNPAPELTAETGGKPNKEIKPTVECAKEKVNIKLQRSEMIDPMKDVEKLTFKVVQKGTELFTLKWERKSGGSSGGSDPQPGGTSGDTTKPPANPLEASTAIDISPEVQPRGNPMHPLDVKTMNIGWKYLIVDENLALRGIWMDNGTKKAVSVDEVSESDTIVVRFVARKAVACRMLAVSSDTNVWDGTSFRFNPPTSLELAKYKFWASGTKATPADAAASVRTSCGYKLLEHGRLSDAEKGAPKEYSIDSPVGNQYTTVDFRFGPFTNTEVAFKVYRLDASFSAVDLRSTIKVVNHKRYTGWFDVTFGVNVYGKLPQQISVVQDNGSQLKRIRVGTRALDPDIAAFVKVFAVCSSGLPPVDLHKASFCWGFGTGLSIAHPARIFYPIGTNFTFAHGAVSLHAMLSISRVDQLAAGYADKALFSGPASSVPTNERILAGAGFALGLDPMVAAQLVKTAIAGK